jgi:hypothetical protein
MMEIDKKFLFFLIITFTVYPVAELSRLVILAWQEYGLIKQWWIELLLIDAGWLLAMFLVWLVLNLPKRAKTKK